MTGLYRTYGWGPTFKEDGVTSFRLWAPEETSVYLAIGDKTREMSRQADGWFEIEIARQPFGEEYGFVLSDGSLVPDPASRHQAGVLGPSRLVDPNSHRWRNQDWTGRRWEEAVFYELHVGTFTRDGTFGVAAERLAHLADIGFTAVEVMPLAHFPGSRGRGYDGVFHYAPFSRYGSADDFEAFVDTAHGLGLMVFLDVVYNHFGPEGNFLSKYAPQFFREDRPTPWGDSIAFANEPVKRFFIDNAVYWLTEYHLDGLRFDAIDQIEDDSRTHMLQRLAEEAYASVPDRQIHLITENPANGTDLMARREDGRRLYKADWNDDFHHAMHAAATGEITGHYAAFAAEAWKNTARALAEGYLVDGKRILQDVDPPASSLPTTCFVHFLQNHDQVGNRALGDRLHMAVDPDLHAALVEMLVLAPQIPLFFQGDDHLSTRPFRFFADYEGDLRTDVWKNREGEARNFGGFPDGFGPDDIPDPSDPTTFTGCQLDWDEARRPEARDWQSFLKRLLKARATYIIPLIGEGMVGGQVLDAPEQCVFVDWTHSTGVLKLRANFSSKRIEIGSSDEPEIYPGKVPQGDPWLHARSVRVFNSRTDQSGTAEPFHAGGTARRAEALADDT